MKLIGILFLLVVGFAVYKVSHANTLPTNKFAFCSGYASKMHETYRLKYYMKMQQFFDNKLGNNQDEFTAEYYQSGSEFVKPGVSIKENLNDKCESLFKG